MRAAADRGSNIGRRALAAGVAALAAAPAAARAGSAHADGPWPMLAQAIFKDAPIHDGAGLFAIEAPYRAADAALVPIAMQISLPENDSRRVERVSLVIDQNPSPLAASFSLGAGSGIDRIETHVRVDDYTYLHAVAALSDGGVYAVRRYVKAAGGCSAPAVRDEAGGPPLGTMRFREFAPRPGLPAGLREAQLMIRHPNNSGMQMDQITRYYIPAHFITRVRIWQGATLLLAIESGISIAQNPSFRFRFRPQAGAPAGTATFRADATDNMGGRFAGHWPAVAA
ncbi:MAG TPA: quinoprotein dehydrogenase-associated SoxYZ-like carrier [Acetobacteraceae bacterium]|nr:quinoprotein dehydrogenase-associated SoxYZ-like carrier [Acetobacteraceae bacterium]